MGDKEDYYESLKMKAQITEPLNHYQEVNKILNEHGFFFISPLFYQGFDLENFRTLHLQGLLTKEEIEGRSKQKFYNLNMTAGFIEGYCARSKFVEPFLLSIEHSVILAFQQDYEGAIKTLLPVLEGILRCFLRIEKNNKNPSQKAIIDFIPKLESEIVEKRRSTYYSPYRDRNKQEVELTKEEVDALLVPDKEYFEVWCGFLNTYFKDHLFQNTENPNFKPAGNLNRQVIFHGYLPCSELGFNGFIKVYFAMQFLTWLMLEYECKSTMNEIDTLRFLDKALSYQKVIENSKKLWFDKHVLYQGKSGYEDLHFDEKIKPFLEFPLKPKHKIILWISRQYKKMWWKLVPNLGKKFSE